MIEYVVVNQDPKGDWEVHFYIHANSPEEAAEKIANGDTGEMGFEPRGTGRYLVVPKSRIKDLDIEEVARYQVKEAEDEG